MKLSDLSIYTETIVSLLQKKIPVVVTGTFALYLQNNRFADHYTIKDCDLFIEYNYDILSAFINHMQANNWFVQVWEEELDQENLMRQLEGKFYIRCKRENLILDATFEHEASIYGDPEYDVVSIDTIPVISAPKILSGKKYRGTERDKKAIRCFELL